MVALEAFFKTPSFVYWMSFCRDCMSLTYTEARLMALSFFASSYCCMIDIMGWKFFGLPFKVWLLVSKLLGCYTWTLFLLFLLLLFLLPLLPPLLAPLSPPLPSLFCNLKLSWFFTGSYFIVAFLTIFCYCDPFSGILRDISELCVLNDFWVATPPIKLLVLILCTLLNAGCGLPDSLESGLID